MPEGDTLHRAAARLRPALEGKSLARFEAPRLVGDRPALGSTITAVEATGKNLLLRFGDGLTVRTHLRMTGSWHLYRAGDRWRKPPWLARLVIGVEGWEAVCFSAPVVESWRGDEQTPRPVADLCPDLSTPGADLDAAVARFAAYARPGDEVGALLLDQRIASGIGNVYKSEVCFACGLDPFTPIEALDGAARRTVLATAARLLRANLGSGPRTTVPGGLAVYGRNGRPCRRCGTTVRVRRQGDQARSTYWCPSCQPPRREPA
jgi:endonuclease-8